MKKKSKLTLKIQITPIVTQWSRKIANKRPVKYFYLGI
jgi:hypothetical protein